VGYVVVGVSTAVWANAWLPISFTSSLPTSGRANSAPNQPKSTTISIQARFRIARFFEVQDAESLVSRPQLAARAEREHFEMRARGEVSRRGAGL
jgi:hypothetical protein